jgi:phage terminase large subunit-like protein
LMQADKGLFASSLFFASSPDAKENLDLWVGYYGFELAKALPVIDWADIYKLQPGEDLLRPAGTMGMHAVFAARLAVDLILIASLLQAIAIATRNRQQKSLFAAGHINRLDELVEKEEIKRALSRRRVNWFNGPVNFRRYDRERLKEIYFRSIDSRERTFIETIFTEAGDSLDSAINVLRRIVENHGSEDELYRTLDAVRSEHEAGAHTASIEDMILIMAELRARSGLKDFKFALIKLAREIGTPYQVASMMDFLMFGKGRDTFQYTRIEAAKTLTAIAPALPECSQILDLIASVDREGQAAFGAAQFVPTVLHTALRSRAAELGCLPDAA